jgi:hypothetical protein
MSDLSAGGGCVILGDIGYVQHDRDEMEALYLPNSGLHTG